MTPTQLQVFGWRLKQIRRLRSWSQATVASKAQLSRSHVGRLEQGRCDPPLTTIYRLASALGVAAGKLL